MILHLDKEAIRIGQVANYYGCLYVNEQDGKYYWVIENYNTEFEDSEHYDEIDKELYDALIDFNNRMKK